MFVFAQSIWEKITSLLVEKTFFLFVIIFVVGVLIFLMFAASLERIRRQKKASAAVIPSKIYCQRDDFLTEAEFAFYSALKVYVGEQAIICPKVNLADLFFPTCPKEERQKYRNKINRKHVDFLLCHPETMKPLCGVELDDSSHEEIDRIARDIFVDSVYEDAGLPLIHIPLQNGYSIEALQEYFGDILDICWEEIQSDGRDGYVELGEYSIPRCPKCGELMVLRVYSSGERKGYRYFGCPNFPQCRTAIDYVTGRITRV